MAKQAFDAVDSLIRVLGPGGPVMPHLNALRDNLAEAHAAEQTVADLRKQVGPLKNEIASLNAKTVLVEQEYRQRTEGAKSAYDAYAAKIQEMESAKQAQIEALNAQANGLETAIEATKKALADRLRDVQVQAGAKQAELEKTYAARKALLDAEESAARERVEGYKAELALLLKRVTG